MVSITPKLSNYPIFLDHQDYTSQLQYSSEVENIYDNHHFQLNIPNYANLLLSYSINQH